MICRANQLTGFSVVATLAFNELIMVLDELDIVRKKMSHLKIYVVNAIACFFMKVYVLEKKMTIHLFCVLLPRI